MMNPQSEIPSTPGRGPYLMKDVILSGRQYQHGVTLIELLVAVAVVIILALVAIPSIITIIQKHRLVSNTENLYATLQLARSEAIKRNTNVYVSLTTGDTWCYGVNPGATCNCAVANNCSLGSYTYSTAGQLTLSASGLSGNSIYFEGSHGAANASGTITFTLYGQSTLMTVSIGRMGGLQICATGISGYTAC